jgi:uncharacterized protein YgbK (DUF1537 family)
MTRELTQETYDMQKFIAVKQAINQWQSPQEKALLREGEQLQQEDLRSLQYLYDVLRNCAEAVSDACLLASEGRASDMLWRASRSPQEMEAIKARYNEDRKAVEAVAYRLLGPLPSEWRRLKFDSVTGAAIGCD